MVGDLTIKSPLKRIAWAYGCARKGSVEEARLRSLLMEKLGACCDEPDGDCEGCDGLHGHTCRACDEEWCRDCWSGAAHAEFCPEDKRNEESA